MKRNITAVVVGILALVLGLMLPPTSTTLLAADKPATPEMKLKVGEMAPDFTLKDQSGKEVSLHDFKGKKSVVLAFYVFAFTGG